MKYNENQKQETRNKILDAAKKSFKRYGYAGIGVDGLAKNAGVTSGAFYGYFPSKEVAFIDAAIDGVKELTDAIMQMRKQHGAKWPSQFIDFYLSQRRICPLEQSCAVQTITSDIMRADVKIKSIFQEELHKAVKAIADGLDNIPDENRKKNAWALLSVLSGGVTLARACNDENIILEITNGVRENALCLTKTSK